MGVGLTEADLYEYKQMCAGKYGPPYTAIRKLVDEVRQARRDLLATRPAGTIRNNDLDSVLLASTELHKSTVALIAKLRPIPIEEAAFPRERSKQPVLARPERAAAPNAEPRKLLSVKQAAMSIGISTSTFYRLVLEGRIKSVKVGNRRLVPVTAIDEFIASGGDAD